MPDPLTETRPAPSTAEFAAGVLVADLDGRLLQVDPRLTRLLGRTAAELRGLELVELTHADDRARLQERLQFLRTGTSDDLPLELRFVRADGSLLTSLTTLTRFAAEFGLRERLVGAVDDLAYRERARERERELEGMRARLASVVESSDDAIATKDLDGVVRTWNRGAERIFGWSAAEMVGQSIFRLIPPELHDEERGILARQRRGERIEHYETVRIGKDGRRIDISLTVSPIRDGTGKIVGASKVARDITARKRAEAELRRSEDELRNLADSIPHLAWIANAEGEAIWFNRGWHEYAGSVDVMHKEARDSLHDPEILPRVQARWSECVRTSTPFEMEFPLRGPDGSFRWFLTRARPIRDDDGRVLRWFGTCTDVHEVKRAREALLEESRLLELLNETGKSIAANLDLQALLQNATDATTRLSGAEFGAFFYNTKDENGDSLLLYTLSGAAREAFERFGQPRATPLFAPTFRGERAIRLDDVRADPRYGQWGGMPEGHLPVRSYLAVPVVSRSGEVIGGLFFGHSRSGVFTERTERIVTGVAAQAAVAIDNARLYEDVRRAAEERQQLLEAERSARAEAERLNLVKDEFLANLSHELRTPLHAIVGWAQVLRTRNADAEIAEGLAVIDRNARMQAQLIEDLLDMSRIISGKLRLDVQRVDVQDLVRAAVASLRQSAEAKGIRLEVVLDPRAGPVRGDSNRLQQCFWNLLANAVKFTPKGGRVQISLARVASHVEFTVADDGQGIAPAFLPHVFERFRQADSSTTRHHGGLGLGLAIVASLVELHGGSVHASSPGPGRGATFTIRLPVLAVEAEPTRGKRDPLAADAPAHAAPNQPSLVGITVLAVDDEPDARALVKRLLEDCGARVLVADSARAGLELLERERPDILISDIGMPTEDGYTFIREVRELGAERGGRIAAVALSALARPEDRTRALRAGYQIHLAKPLDPSELTAAVSSLAMR
jgi:PAS domain S-box-containing protein